MKRCLASPRRLSAALAGLAGAVSLGLPSLAAACSACLYGAYGDRTFNWAFVALIAMPFVVGAGIGGALLHRYGRLRAPLWSRRRATPGSDHLAAHEETT